MKKLTLTVALLIFAGTTFAFDDARTLFARVLEDGVVAETLAARGAQIISLKQNFIPAGRVSHTNVEVTFGRPDGTGGYSEVDCVARQVVEHARGPYRFIAAPETCRG